MKASPVRINKNNQLLIKPATANKYFAADGRFSVDKDNNLIYLLNEPAAWRREYSLPNKIKFKGKWKLNANYDLQLHLDKTKNQFESDYLTLSGRILCAESEGFVFQLKSQNKRGVNRFSLLKLSGIWQADKYNRITFQVKKKANPDTFVFTEVWQINKNQQIVYEYERRQTKTKRKLKDSFTLTGYWQTFSANRLCYILSHSFDSRFDFRVHIQTPNIYPKKGTIKYRLGIGIRQDLRPAKAKIITLYGTWKFSRKLGLSFQMDYGQDKTRSITFGAELYLSTKDNLIFKLTDSSGKRAGISVIFSHRFLANQDVEWFLLLKKRLRQKRAETGVRGVF